MKLLFVALIEIYFDSETWTEKNKAKSIHGSKLLLCIYTKLLVPVFVASYISANSLTTIVKALLFLYVALQEIVTRL